MRTHRTASRPRHRRALARLGALTLALATLAPRVPLPARAASSGPDTLAGVAVTALASRGTMLYAAGRPLVPNPRPLATPPQMPGTGSRIYRSTDGGRTWQSTPLATGVTIVTIAVAPAGGGLVAVGCVTQETTCGRGKTGGVVVLSSPDAGRTWATVAIRGMASYAYPLANATILPSGRAVACGSMGAASGVPGAGPWRTRAVLGLMLNLCALAATPDGRTIYLYDATGLLVKSTNGGVSWKLCGGSTRDMTRPVDFGLPALTAGPARGPDAGTLWLTVRGGIGASTDGGKTVHRVITYPPRTISIDEAIAPDGQTVAVLQRGNTSSLSVARPGGSWRAIGLTTARGPSYYGAFDAASAADGAQRLWFVPATHMAYTAGPEGGLYAWPVA